MGASVSAALPSRSKLRDVVLLRLHHMLSGRQECIETWLLHAFQKHDPTNQGHVPLETVAFIAESMNNKQIFLRRDECRRIADVFDLDSDGRFHYMQFIWFVLPPGKMFIKEDKSIGMLGIYMVSKGSWDVGQLMITIKRVELNQQSMEMVEDARKDIALLASLSHPNLLRYIGSSVADSTLSICQEWSEASSLRTILAAFGRMSEPTIRRYVVQVVEGVLYLHERDILHRNIHGESVYIDTAGLEFNVGPTLRTMHLGHHTHGDSIYAKYPPPETKGGRWGKKADVWLIGLLALEMVVGSAFFNKPQTSVVPPMPEHLSLAFRAFFVHCFEVNPRARATAEDLSLHPFFQLDPIEDTNRMLSEVCSSLDVTMKVLHESTHIHDT
ncbi:Aste57867_18504 [Aphanomyces stellatus]|uniref:Aste57867_18504 protein n=1 Tax=Aphanomyces stellatus TaxID=120398 RepID=A0A485LAA2_9STRA|nr:hypothetical protein As57867_018442 [Aphanomyces stellatus]VFT95240.1 Aste57867_18504 [Aphanomyces stellatus]